MSKVSRFDTPQELIVRKYLFRNGYRFRKNYRKLPGSPDIVLPKYKTVVFVHGCFWHYHSCKAGKIPRSNQEFWIKKLEGNRSRDKAKKIQLKKLGWHAIEVWQCQLKKSEERTLKKIIDALANRKSLKK